MSIAEATIETLEFPKIREQLARYTAFSASRTLALELVPSTTVPEVGHRLQLTSEARRLLDEHPETTIGGARDIRAAVQHAARGGVLEAGVFLEIATTLESMRRLRGMLFTFDATAFPLLNELAVDLPQLPTLEEEILRTIDADGTVLDSASPALSRIRSEVRIAFQRLQERLQNLLHSPQFAPALQEPIITVRNGRYVVPVKAAQRRVIRGVVHDQSASGATLYVEPLATLELNNRWRELQLAEEDEIARILAVLAERVGAAAPEMTTGIEALALLDLAFAKAKYALALRCVAPELSVGSARTDSDQPPLALVAARHPLLNQSTVVPTDIWLGNEFNLLLITGPNTGGKTVALKTVGLLALMAQAGLHIPANAPSRLPVFTQIFADIGDEQSIEQSLSTFSSHMTTIIHILGALDASADAGNASNERLALVLLDELGAGTDPVEGSALARAIVERLLEQGCLGIATTHYAELKAFAYSTPGVQNASVEFDVETLAPTYRLTIGLPGRSNALAIAARLGLDAALVERARSTMAREDVQVEDLLAQIHQEREATAAEFQRTAELRADAEKYRDRLAEELREFTATRQAQIEAAQQSVEEELREVRAQLRRMRDEFRSVSLSRQWLEEAEQRLHVTQEQAQEVARKSRPAPTSANVSAGPRPLQVGDTVKVRSIGLNGEIVAIDEEEQAADVQVGGFRMHVGLDELHRAKRDAADERQERYRAPRSITVPAAPDVSMTLDMRGWRTSEVADKLDRYLNDAYLANLSEVRLVHGKGTGALRQVVRDVLEGHPLVMSFSGGGTAGGDGVTVAKIVER